MERKPHLYLVDKITIPARSEWIIGQDDNIYYWVSPQDAYNSSARSVTIYRSEDRCVLPLIINDANHILAVDKKSCLYIGQNINVGEWVGLYAQTGECLWKWHPVIPIHTFAYTIDSLGKFYYVPSDTNIKNIYCYQPKLGVEIYDFPVLDTVYGIAVNNRGIYSIQLPIGHFVVLSGIEGEIKKMIGDLHNLGKDNESLWPVFYPEEIQLDRVGNLWIAEMGRQCLTVLDPDLNILKRFYQTDLGIQITREQEFRFMRFHIGYELLCIEHSTDKEIQLYSYIVT
jgi:hypothetical protein